MLKLLQVASRWLAKYTSFFIIGVAVITFFFFFFFDLVQVSSPSIILGIIMLTMGLTLTTNDFKILAHRPMDICIGACAQFIIMPGVAYLLVHIWHLEPALALGILLVGCCPGGVPSNIMSYLCHGDVAFSVGMTCASTLLAPVMTPFLMKLTAGAIIRIDTVGMFLNILIVTIIPVALGCLLNYVYSKKECFPTIQSLMPGTSVICLALIVGGVISTVHDDLVVRGFGLFIWTFTVVFCHNTLGYLLGWVASTVLARSIAMRVGRKSGIPLNIGLAARWRRVCRMPRYSSIRSTLMRNCSSSTFSFQSKVMAGSVSLPSR